MTIERRLRLGMVGGGEGAFIGAVHRIAARLDDAYELTAAALSSDPTRAKSSAATLHIAPERAYTSYAAMAEAEAARPDGIDVVAIVTPNHLHAPVAAAFLRAGIDVICDKPVTHALPDAEALAALVAETGRIFVLTHNYTGYPMVRQAREMVAAGAIGRVRVVQVEYAQDWLSTNLEASGQKQAAWRTDPARSGAGGSLGDIGTHAFNLAEFVAGDTVATLAADVQRFVPGRALDDNAQILLRFASGARGALWCSQVAPGNANALRLRIFGETGGLEWQQEHPNELRHTPLGEPPHTLARGGPALGAAAADATRIPGGHPEGYLEGFAQIYRDAALLLRAKRAGTPPPASCALLPGIAEGVRGMRFITAAVASGNADAAWRDV